MEEFVRSASSLGDIYTDLQKDYIIMMIIGSFSSECHPDDFMFSDGVMAALTGSFLESIRPIIPYPH